MNKREAQEHLEKHIAKFRELLADVPNLTEDSRQGSWGTWHRFRVGNWVGTAELRISIRPQHHSPWGGEGSQKKLQCNVDYHENKHWPEKKDGTFSYGKIIAHFLEKIEAQKKANDHQGVINANNEYSARALSFGRGTHYVENEFFAENTLRAFLKMDTFPSVEFPTVRIKLDAKVHADRAVEINAELKALLKKYENE